MSNQLINILMDLIFEIIIAIISAVIGVYLGYSLKNKKLEKSVRSSVKSELIINVKCLEDLKRRINEDKRTRYAYPNISITILKNSLSDSIIPFNEEEVIKLRKIYDNLSRLLQSDFWYIYDGVNAVKFRKIDYNDVDAIVDNNIIIIGLIDEILLSKEFIMSL